MARPYWNGFLKLSLVSCPISVYPATSSTERISFRQINKRTGNRLRQQLVDEVTKQVVEAVDKGRGYEVDKGVCLPVDDEEIEALQIESSSSIAIDKVVPKEQIDRRFLDKPYYIAPSDQVGQEAFAVIRDALRADGKVALGRVVFSKRERVIAIEPFEDGLIGTTLLYPYEVRNATGAFSDIPKIKTDAEAIKLAKHILQQKAGDFDPAEMTDHYEIALVDLMKKKQAGFKPPREKPGRQNVATNVVNLMDALKRSIKDDAGKGTAKKKSSGRRAA